MRAVITRVPSPRRFPPVWSARRIAVNEDSDFAFAWMNAAQAEEHMRIGLAQATHSPRGVHALLKCCEAAICAAVVEAAVNCTPRIVLGLSARAHAQ
jgi:hypothetical protein